MTNLHKSESAPDMRSESSKISLTFPHYDAEKEASDTVKEPSDPAEDPKIIRLKDATTSSDGLQQKPPSRLLFLGKVYALVFALVVMSLLQWLGATYRWRPKMGANERNFYVLMLTLASVNMTLGFLGFRRMQLSFPINWLTLIVISETLVLLVMGLAIRELDLTWHYMLVGIVLVPAYTVLGFYVPTWVPPHLWILMFMSISVAICSFMMLALGLTMHFYVPLCMCLIVFGPWAMYNSQKVHSIQRRSFPTQLHLRAALMIYMNFALTVGGTCVITRGAAEMDVDRCRHHILCSRRLNTT